MYASAGSAFQTTHKGSPRAAVYSVLDPSLLPFLCTAPDKSRSAWPHPFVVLHLHICPEQDMVLQREGLVGCIFHAGFMLHSTMCSLVLEDSDMPQQLFLYLLVRPLPPVHPAER
mmetsp:Transcript_91429/g.153180  ORF Transcript_91429/g.153180 Transcript_91429/m.153180 type:complete len:115 (+) Transcript_91429:250-594(+)